MIWLLIILWFAGCIAAGYPLARMVLANEGRRSVLGSYALIVGHCLQGVVLLALWGVMPLGAAYYITVGSSILAGTVLSRALPRIIPNALPNPAVSRAHLLALAPLLIGFALLGYRMFTITYSFDSQESLFFHAATVGEMSRSAYPPTSPLEPDDPLRYRFGLHSLAAALAANSHTTPPDALAYAVGMILPLLAIAFYGASVRLFNTPLPGILASLFALFGGSLSPYFAIFQMLGSNRTPDLFHAINGIMWHGNTLDMIAISVTATMGMAVFSIAVWLYWESARLPDLSVWRAVPVVISFTYLGYVNEVYYSVLVAGVSAVGGIFAIQSLRQRQAGWWRLACLAAAVGLLSFLLIQVRGGLAGGISLFADGPSSMQLTLNTDHFGAAITPPRGIPDQWIPIFSPLFQVDTNFWIVVLPALLAIMWRTQHLYGAIALAASVAAFGSWVLVYPRQFPADIYRFGQAALVIYVSVMPLAVAAFWRSNRLPRWRLRYLVEALLIALLIAPHLARTAILMVSPPEPTLLTGKDTDYVAAEFLSTSLTTSRVFVPLARSNGSWEDMYDRTPNTPGSAMRTMLALSGHALPVGHQVYFNPLAYLPYYRQASQTFDTTVLARLKIDWVYVLPASLSREQRANLDAVQSKGELTLVRSFGERNTPTERLLFRAQAPN